ncbi:hypothetical protein BC828DRAFT_148674 [Blastocladiella britannica]|nr:hypothetical protein BC828DRAFT_148674 [Blastocladiella britannica]
MPEKATTVLNALPKYRAPAVLAAVLSRGFQVVKPPLAAKHRHEHLLPHYQAQILFDTLLDTLGAAGARGDILTIELPWKLAGPSTIGRASWLRHSETSSMIAGAIGQGRVPVLEWMRSAARAIDISIDISIAWTSQHGPLPSLWDTRTFWCGPWNVDSWQIWTRLVPCCQPRMAVQPWQTGGLHGSLAGKQPSRP